MSRSKLEEVLQFLINEEREKAEEALHEFIVQRARSIHQQLIAEDEEMDDEECDDDEDLKEDFDHLPGADDHEIDDNQDQIESEEYFSEDDLAPEEDETEMELDTEELPEEGDDVDLEDKVADLEAEFERLSAEFEALKNDDDETAEDGELDAETMDDEVADDEVADDEEGDDFNFDSDEEVDSETAEDELDEGSAGVYGETGGGDEEWEPDEMGNISPGYGEPNGIYEDLDESQAMDYLSRVAQTDKTDGEGIGKGGYDPKGNSRKSPLKQEKIAARLSGAGSKDLPSKQSQHKGFARQPAPTVKEPPVVGQNTTKGNKKLQSHVTHEGDNAALLNKNHSDGYGQEQKASPIGSKKLGNNSVTG